MNCLFLEKSLASDYNAPDTIHDSSCQAHVLIFGAPGDREEDRQLILARLLAGFLTASFYLIFIARGVYDR